MSITPPETPRPNANTFFRLPSMEVSKEAMRLVWERARTMLLEAPRVTELGYTLLWTNGRESGFRTLKAARNDFVVIGRHTACDVVLSQDDTLSLRHLLARTVVLDDGSVALRFLDLKTAVPLCFEDGAPRRSVVVSGPTLFRVGDYVLGAVPHDPAERFAVHGQGPYRRAEAPRIVTSQRLPRNAGREPGRRTLITILPDAPSLHEAASFAPDASSSLPSGARMITLNRGYDAVTVTLGAAALEAGVLVGRAPKCMDQGLRSVLNLSVSRVHLLLVREGSSDMAYDLCSTQGTFAINHRVRSLRLPSSGATLTLAQNSPLDLWWHPHK